MAYNIRSIPVTSDPDDDGMFVVFDNEGNEIGEGWTKLEALKNAKANVCHTKVAGTTFRLQNDPIKFNRAYYGVTCSDFSLKLEVDPENPHDPNAIKVVVWWYDWQTQTMDRYQIGFLPKDVSAKLAGKDLLHAEFVSRYEELNNMNIDVYYF